MTDSAALPRDVRLMPLKTHADPRGQLTELFRNEWHQSPLPAQWIIVRSDANSLRGMYVHAHHWRYLCTVIGEICVGMCDARPEMPGRSAMLRLDSRNLHMLLIPPGMVHGFYAPGDSTTLLGCSGPDPLVDCRRCRWDAPELGLDWPCAAPELSALDRDAGSYAEMKAGLLTGRVA